MICIKMCFKSRDGAASSRVQAAILGGDSNTLSTMAREAN